MSFNVDPNHTEINFQFDIKAADMPDQGDLKGRFVVVQEGNDLSYKLFSCVDNKDEWGDVVTSTCAELNFKVSFPCELQLN